jgi:hypothetical protein
MERMLNFLTALDRDVKIVTQKKPGSRKSGKIMVSQNQLSTAG